MTSTVTLYAPATLIQITLTNCPSE